MTNRSNDTSDAGGETVGPIPETTSKFKPLRIWPTILLVAGMVSTRWVPTLVEDGPPTIWMVGALGPLVCGALVMLWWLAASRAWHRG